MAIEVVVKEWGNSLGIVLPRELVKKEHIKKNKKIIILAVLHVRRDPRNWQYRDNRYTDGKRK